MQYLSHKLKLNFKYCEVSLTFKMMEILIEHFPSSVNFFWAIINFLVTKNLRIDLFDRYSKYLFFNINIKHL